MEPVELLRFTPVVTAALWLGLVAYLVTRDRFRTWSEILLLATCLSIVGYAAADVAFLNAPSASFAAAALQVSYTFRTLLAMFFLLLAAVLHGRMRRSFSLLAVPALLALVLVWTSLVSSMVTAPGTGAAFGETYDPLAYALWLVFALAYVAIGLGLLARVLLQVRRLSPALGRRMQLELSASTLAVVVGEAISLVGPRFGVTLPPVLSSLLAIPGVAVFVTMSPDRETPFLEAAHRWKSGAVRVKAAFLTYVDGTLIDSKVPLGAPKVDGSFTSSTLEVVQDFLRTSFPALAGGSLRSVVQGDTTFVLERGQSTCLILVLEGRENDQLRRLMRDALRGCEDLNRDVFGRWHGDPAEVRGTGAMLADFLSPEP